MFSRIFRPLTAPLASSASIILPRARALPVFSIFPVKSSLTLPARPRTFAARTFAISTVETDAPANSPSPELPPQPPQTPETESAATESVATESVATESVATESVPTESAVLEAPSTPTQQATLPYFVNRNHLNNFGVYQKNKRGGNLKLTYLKKGEGNLQALRHDLKEVLQLQDTEISVNNITRHIVIKGHVRDQVVHFLRTMGF